MEPLPDLKRQASSLVLQQRLLEIETKLRSIELSSVASPKSSPSKTDSSASSEIKVSRRSQNDPEKRNSHRSNHQRSRPQDATIKKADTKERGSKANTADISRSSGSASARDSSSQTRPSGAPVRSYSRQLDTSSSSKVGQEPKLLRGDSRSILAAAEQRLKTLEAENARLLSEIAVLTSRSNEQQKAIAAAEEKNAQLKKEHDQATTSLANKVVFQKQITADVVNKYEILKKDYTDLKAKFDEQVDLVDSLRTKLLQVTSALTAAQQQQAAAAAAEAATSTATPSAKDDRDSMRSSSAKASSKSSEPITPTKSDAIADNKSSSSGFKVPKSPSFLKFLTRRRNSDAPRPNAPVPAPVPITVQAPLEATARGISEFALNTIEEKSATAYTYATDDGTESESSRADSPSKKRPSSSDATGKLAKSMETKSNIKITPVKTPLSASSAAKVASPRRGSVGAIPMSSQGLEGDRGLASSPRPAIVPVQPLKGSPSARRIQSIAKFGIIFGVKRGNCTENGCSCACFVKSDTGSQCKSCSHFPSQHANLGEVSAGDETLDMAPRTTPRDSVSAQSSAPVLGRTQAAPSSARANQEHTEKTKNELREQLGETWLLEYSDFYFVEQLGKGNSSTVFLGTYKQSEVALKVLRLENHRRDLDDFKKELEIMSAVRSPYIVHFYGATLEPKLVICLEYCSKGSLFHFLQDPESDLSWSLILRWMTEAVKGIDTLHQWSPSIVHRDLKTLNLLLDKNMTLKVCDFGLSRFVQAEQAPATLFKLRGTYAYIGPEVYHGSAFTTKTDVYSLAVVLWEMVHRLIVGRHCRPYYEYPALQHDFQIIIQAATKGLRPTIPAQCPAPVADFMRLCWNADPQLRPSCEDMLKHIERLSREYEDRKSIWDRVVFSARTGSGNISSGSTSSRNGTLRVTAGSGGSDSSAASPSKP